MSGRGLPWYKRDPVRFLDGVQGLGPDLIGAYAVVLDLIYARDGKTRRDDRHLAGILGCSKRLARSLTDRLIEAGKIVQRGEWLEAGDQDIFDCCERFRPAVPVPIARAVRSRDGERCAYCGSDRGPFHLDHIMPWSRGGDHRPDNLTVACASCNLSKGAKTIAEWGGTNG